MFKITNKRLLTENIYLMDVEAPRVAKSAHPGQFVIVKIDEKGERIPLIPNKQKHGGMKVFKITNKRLLTENIYLMDVEAPRVAKSAHPGQFVIVKIDEKGERIPLTICDYDANKSC